MKKFYCDLMYNFSYSISCCLLVLLNLLAEHAGAEEAWEFSPYKVCVWFTLDPSLDRSAAARRELTQRSVDQLKSTFGPAWHITATPAPADLESLIERGPETLSVENFSLSDLVLVVIKDDPNTKTLRVLESAVEQLSKIALTKSDRELLVADSLPFVESDKSVQMLLEKASEVYETYGDLAIALREAKIAGALIPRGQLSAFAEIVRPVATSLPWHTERTLHEFDKLIIVHCQRRGESYHVAVRELDCPMRMFGPTIRGSSVAWQSLPFIFNDCSVRAFAPVARIEEASGKSVFLRTRAGGLVSSVNPARIQPGDVLQPVIRRDDRRGVATLLEPIPWTYIGVTGGDSVNIEGTVFSALGNVLQGKQTRRAQRVALRVRPIGSHSDMKIVVRNNLATAQPGCQVYERDLMTEELRFVGNTDWRGIITIETPDPLGLILPESERIKRAEARRLAAEAASKAAVTAEAEQATAAKSAAASEEAQPSDEDKRGPAAEPTTPETKASEEATTAARAVPAGATAPDAGTPPGTATPGTATPGTATPDAADGEAASDAPTEQNTDAGNTIASAAESAARAASVQLRQPLMLFYVKSGDLVLARLPLVPGLNELDIADLPSDARRLEAEAILRGFQADIIDLIGKRALAGARVALYLSEQKYSEAEEIIGEVRRLRDYKSMADTLNAIQRRLLDETQEAVPMAAKSRIDRMTQTTRDMLQKYLENDLVLKLDRDLKQAREKATAAEKAADAAAAAAKAKAAEAKTPGSSGQGGTKPPTGSTTTPASPTSAS